MPPRLNVRRVKIDFFKVVEPDGVDFGDLIRRVARLPAGDTSRNVDARGYPVRLHEHHLRTYHEADLVKIRMDDVPVKASLVGAVQPFELGADEGVGEQTAFLYDPSTKVVALQRNRYGVSASMLAFYFQNLCGVVEPIDMDPILHPDALRRLAGIQEVRHFEFRVAGADASLFADQGHGIKEMAEIIREFGAPNIGLELSMGHNRGSMTVARVIRAAKRLFASAGVERPVKKLVVSGVTAADEMIVLDLLNDRMTEIVEIHTDGPVREVGYTRRRAALSEAFTRRQGELRRMSPQD